MQYKIIANDHKQNFTLKMGRSTSEHWWISDALEIIADFAGYRKEIKECISETHALAVLQSFGLDIKLLEADGSPMDY